MIRISVFWQAIVSFLVLLILPLSALASRGIVPLFFVLFLSIGAYWLTHQKQFHLNNIFNDIKLTPSLVVLGLFLLWTLLSAFWSVNPKQTLYLWIKILFLLSAGVGLSSMFQALDKGFRGRLLLALMLGIILMNTWLMIEIKTQGKLLSLIKGKDFYLTYYNKALSLEVMLIWPVLAYLYRFFRSNLDQEIRHLVLMLQLALFLQVALVTFWLHATTVKIAFIVGAVIGILFLVERKIFKWIFLGACVVVFLTAPVLYKKFFVPAVTASIVHKYIEKPSFYHRLYIWKFVSEEILSKPWTGWGLDASRDKYFSEKKILSDEIKKQTPFLNILSLDLLPLHPHNLPLQLWLELGFPGVVLIIYLIGLVIFAIPRLFKENFNRSAAYASFSSALIVNMGSYGIWQSWWISGLWLTLIFVRFLESRND